MIVNCPKCEGRGYLTKSFVSSEIAWQGQIECPNCGGTGKIVLITKGEEK